MTTFKEFENQKQEVADYFVNKFLCKIIRKDDEVNHLLKLIDNLQPPRPTCVTCEYCSDIVKWGELESQCCNQNVHSKAAGRNMGCIHHSELENND